MDDKLRTRNWRSVRAEMKPDEDAVAQHKRNQMDEVRAYRLAEVRKSQGRTQQDVADSLLVAQARVSKLERGDLARSEVGTIRSYVEALGGHLRIVADFGDETLTLS